MSPETFCTKLRITRITSWHHFVLKKEGIMLCFLVLSLSVLTAIFPREPGLAGFSGENVLVVIYRSRRRSGNVEGIFLHCKMLLTEFLDRGACTSHQQQIVRHDADLDWDPDQGISKRNFHHGKAGAICYNSVGLAALVKICILQRNLMLFRFSALTPLPLVGQQEGHPVCRKSGVGLLVVMTRLKLCTYYSSSCHHHFRHPKLQ